MKKATKLYVLSGILAVVCIAAFAVSKYETKQEEIRNSDEVILSLDADTVTALSWEYEEESLGFHKDAGEEGESTWLYDEDDAFPVSEEKIGDLLDVFSEFGVSFVIENVEDYDQYGLEDPTCTIHIVAGDTTYDISLGSYSTMDSERYVSIGDGNVYLASHDPFDDYELTLSDMILHDEVPYLTEADAITFSGTENYSITREEDSTNTYCSDDEYFTDNKPLDTSLVSSYLYTISDLSLNYYVSYNATDEELASYGLDDPELSVTVDYSVELEDEETESRTFVLHVGRNQEELEAARKKSDTSKDSEADSETSDSDASSDLETSADSSSADSSSSTNAGAEEEDTVDESEVTAYVRVGDSGIIYEITSDEYTDLMQASYNALRHKTVMTASFEDMEQIDFTLEGKTYSLTSEAPEEDEDERIWYYEGEELDMTSLRSAMRGLSADSFTAASSYDKEELSFTIYLNSENFPKVTFNFYRYDGTSCVAVVDGEPVCMVARSEVVDLVEAVNAIVLSPAD